MTTLNLLKPVVDIFNIIKPHSTEAWEERWANRFQYGEKNDWLGAYWDSVDHPHRNLLAEEIMRFEPESVLEVGCCCGQNLVNLYKRNNSMKLSGVDINSDAIQYGNNKMKDEKLPISLSVGKASELKLDMYDVIFTDATLIYIGRDKISKVLFDIFRLAKKGVVFVEKHIHNLDWRGSYRGGLWQRDYIEAANRFWCFPLIRAAKLRSEIWAEWSDNGYIVSAERLDDGLGER